MKEGPILSIRDQIAHALMKAHGFDMDNPIVRKDIEQYNMMLDDADTAIEAIQSSPIEAIQSSSGGYSALLGSVTPEGPPVRAQNVKFFSLNSGGTHDIRVHHVREWLRLVGENGVPDSAVVEGSLFCDHTED